MYYIMHSVEQCSEMLEKSGEGRGQESHPGSLTHQRESGSLRKSNSKRAVTCLILQGGRPWQGHSVRPQVARSDGAWPSVIMHFRFRRFLNPGNHQKPPKTGGNPETSTLEKLMSDFPETSWGMGYRKPGNRGNLWNLVTADTWSMYNYEKI